MPMLDALRLDIANLTSLLAVLEHYRQDGIDVTSYMPPPPFKAEKAGFVRSLAKSLCTTDKAVAVTGGLAGANHLELVIAVEEDHYDSSASTWSDSEITLVGTPDSIPKSFFKDSMSEYDTISEHIRKQLSPERLSQPDARPSILKERATEVRQKITASDRIFPDHTSGFREIFCAWMGSDSSKDYTLLPKEGVLWPVKTPLGKFIAQIVVGVWDKKANTVSITNANIPRWINGLGILLGYAYLAFGNPNSKPSELFFLVEALHAFKRFFEYEKMQSVFNKSSLAVKLKTCHRSAHAIAPHDDAGHEYYPLPTCMQRLVANYLSDIIDVALHAKLLYFHRHHHHTSLPPDININDMTVDVVYLNTVDPLSRPSYTSLAKIISIYIEDVDESEPWVAVLKDRRVSAAIHPETAIMCMKRAYCQSAGEFAEQFDSRSGNLISRVVHTPHIGSSRKMCYCCAIVEAWTKQEAGLHVERMDPQRCHGRIVPWLPPRWGWRWGGWRR
ncbi:hypothetical protein BDZ89DRAFT_1136444 [Hymenopellis radicata]|nr:hypothetical protein BDZ89DRAFT_1136444 [Hymenopellis radicata]